MWTSFQWHGIWTELADPEVLCMADAIIAFRSTEYFFNMFGKHLTVFFDNMDICLLKKSLWKELK